MSAKLHGLLVSLLWVAACGGADLQIGHHEAAIIDGIVDTGHHAVGLLVHEGEGGIEDNSLCSATLIAPRFALTAAHCVTDQVKPPFRIHDPLFFFVGPMANFDPETGRLSGAPTWADNVKVYPTYRGAGRSDIALVELPIDIPSDVAAPIPIAPWAPRKGQVVTLVGFGMATEGDKSTVGVRRRASGIVTRRSATTFDAKGRTCHGDSGGPAIASGLVVGVHSGAVRGECTRAVEMRTDFYSDWIAGIVAGLDKPPTPGDLDQASSRPTIGRYGQTCSTGVKCASRICVTINARSTAYKACSMFCDPADPDACPDGDLCARSAGVCVPSGGGKSDQSHVVGVQVGDSAGGCSVSPSDARGLGALLFVLLGLLALRRRFGT
jgi:MYXO-CTERM domain-containing protein